MKKEDIIPYFAFLGVFILLMLIFRIGDKTVSNDPCELHRELFFSEITSGVIIDKFIEKENHATKKAIIKDLNKTYEVLFMPYANWTDFEKIRIGDSITKPSNSFHFSVNHNGDFQLDFQCEYTKN